MVAQGSIEAVNVAAPEIGGHIELDSALGEGTRVRIVLERARVREEAVA